MFLGVEQSRHITTVGKTRRRVWEYSLVQPLLDVHAKLEGLHLWGGNAGGLQIEPARCEEGVATA